MSFWKQAENPRTRPARSWALDIGCAVAAGGAALARFSFGQEGLPGHVPLAAGIVAAVLTAAALPLRRVWPGPVFGWTVLAAAVVAQWPDRGRVFPVALAISLYTVAAMMPRAEAVIAAVLTAGVLVAVIAQDGTRHWVLAVSDAVGLAAAVLIVGLYVGTRRAYLAALSDRARQLEIERDQSSALAAAAERARIAREMHDSVAHHLTVIVALSDGALRAVTRSPAEAAEAIADVSDTARQALAETRRLLGVLRADSGHESRQPLPGLADLDDLVGHVRAAGLPVRYELSGFGTGDCRGAASRSPARGFPARPGGADQHDEACGSWCQRDGPAAAHPGRRAGGSPGRRRRARRRARRRRRRPDRHARAHQRVRRRTRLRPPWRAWLAGHRPACS